MPETDVVVLGSGAAGLAAALTAAVGGAQVTGLGRSISRITDPPFVGHRVRAGVFGTRGGPAIDENGRILGWQNQPIPGLYGTGNVVAHPFASAYPGGGGTLWPAVTFGHIAGRSVLEG